MGILRSDRVSGLGGANAINGSVFFGRNGTSVAASGNWLTVQSDSDFSFGTGDFTIEAWIYYTGTTSSSNSGWFQLSNTVGGINNSNTASAGGLAGDFENGAIKGIGNNGWFNGTVSVTAQSWIHVALVRHSGTLQWFVNGAADTSASDSQNYSLTHLAIGGYYTTSYLFSGYISNFRIVKGTAVYSAAFTPPTERLTAIDGTVLLACQSPGNILQEETGKTLDIRKVTLNDAPPMASHFAPDKGEDHGTTFEDNTKFDTLTYMVPPGGTTTQRGRGRALFGGGSTVINTIQYFNIQSQGNAQDFGDLSAGRYETECASSSTRGLWAGGYQESPNIKVDTVEYVTIATASNVTDFGNLTVARGHTAGVCNSTRGVFANGTTNPSPYPVVNTIDYITIATAGNATDFGDTTTASKPMGGGRSSTTRGVFTLGNTPTAINTMEYVTIASTGNSADFGDAIVSGWARGAGNVSSGTRGILGGGNPALNTIEYITIASTGNGTDFGDLVVGRRSSYAAGSTVRGVFGGGKTPTQLNSIEYITIATTGNAVDFGDMINSKSFASGLSDCHGGLS